MTVPREQKGPLWGAFFLDLSKKTDFALSLLLLFFKLIGKRTLTQHLSHVVRKRNASKFGYSLKLYEEPALNADRWNLT